MPPQIANENIRQRRQTDMKTRIQIIIGGWTTGLLAAALGLSVISGRASADDLLGQEIKGFRYPDYDSQGQLKMEISGDKAQIMPQDLIKITNLRMVLYEEGRAVMHVVTPLCFYDRQKQTATSTSSVSVTRAELIITGQGFDWNEKEGLVSISKKTRVVLKKKEEKPFLDTDLAVNRSAEPAAAKAAQKPKEGTDTNNTVITSERLTFDQNKSVAVFENRVNVLDPALRIQSDHLTISFTRDKKVELLEAEGTVIITRKTFNAKAQKATYAVESGRVTLIGRPIVTREKDCLTAETIVFWRNSNKILCEPNARLMIYSEQDMRSQF